MNQEATLYQDPQTQKEAGYCSRCGGEVYDPSRVCDRCEKRPFAPLRELSRGYREAARPLRVRLRELRFALEKAEDPEEIWHLKRRIAELISGQDPGPRVPQDCAWRRV